MDFQTIERLMASPIGATFGAIIILIVGFFVGKVARKATLATLAKTKIDHNQNTPVSPIIADVVYWFVILLTLTTASGQLGLKGVFNPLTNMMDKVVGFLPYAFMAGVIGVIGMMSAKILKQLTVNLAERTLPKNTPAQKELPQVLGSVVFVMVLVPFVIAGLDALKVDSISRPAINMLSTILETLPSVLSAIGLLALTYYLIKLITEPLNRSLKQTSLDAIGESLGMPAVFRLSDVCIKAIITFAMLFAGIASAQMLGFDQIGALIVALIAFVSQVLFGAMVLAVGFWLADICAKITHQSHGSPFLANIVRVLITGLMIAMGLKAMGIADSIVNLAFGLTLGSVAVAFALAFGLGGKEAAARYLATLQDKLDDKPNTQKRQDYYQD